MQYFLSEIIKLWNKEAFSLHKNIKDSLQQSEEMLLKMLIHKKSL